MPQYLVAIYHPTTFVPGSDPEPVAEEIHALNREMIAAGVRKFACGLEPVANTKTLRRQPDGKALITDGPFIETKEAIGGFWILETADLAEALAWAEKATAACRVPVEVRGMLFRPAPEATAGS